MAVLPIVTFDDDVLRQETGPVTDNTVEIQQLIEDMFDTMYNAEGVGLAAPQVGKKLSLFVADGDIYAEKEGEPAYGPLVLINPSIVFESSETTDIDEGCLSIPGIWGPVTRPERITVEYLDRDFNQQKLEVGGRMARIIQHEMDHLKGILFLDHLSVFKRKLMASKLRELAEGKREDIGYPVVPKKQVS